MTAARSTIELRARRLSRVYPKAWRERFGEEFVALVEDDMAERPHSTLRTLDIFRGGLMARLGAVCLVGPVTNPSRQASGSLAALGAASAVFLVFGVGLWSQLSIGWQWAAPASGDTKMAMVTMSGCVAIFAILAVCAAVPVVWTVVQPASNGRARGLVRPLILLATSALILIIGTRHFANGWPGTGGHPWAQQGLVPGGIAAFAWASTLSITSYWAHPAALGTFPAPELVWMMVSPLALVGAAVGAVITVSRVELSAAVVRCEVVFGLVAFIVMEVFFAAASWWIFDGGSGPQGLFRSGAIDVVMLVFLAGSGVASFVTIHRMRQAHQLLSSR